MAAAEADTRQNGWGKQRRPFSQWVRRLANLKEVKRNHSGPSKVKKAATIKNNPYPESGFQHPRNGKAANDQQSFSDPTTDSASYTSLDEDEAPGTRRAPTRSNKSAAPTVATNPETVNSDNSHSKGGAGRSQGGGGNSTFSSPNHSERSLTTTLTTIQSTAASGLLGPPPGNNGLANTGNTPIQFAHQYPVSPASAIPPHLAPHPHSYHAATANGILSDNASILTLASSSKRRRRHSFDTDASVRALAPSSVWGGSRESLPLSILSDKVESGPQNRPTATLGGHASAERASVYSYSGAQPDRQTLADNRSSYHASKGIDGISVTSGGGHGRSESVTGSIGGVAANSPLASPTIAAPSTTAISLSRRSSDRRIPQADEDVSSSDADATDAAEAKDNGKTTN